MIWHQLDPLRYALWNPEGHYDIKISDADRKKFLDNSLPLNEHIWDVHSYVTESMNCENPENIDIPFANPNEYGYDTSCYGTDSCMAMVASNGKQDMEPLSIPIFITEIVRKTPDCKLRHKHI